MQTPGFTAAVVATAVGQDSAMLLPHCNMGSETTAVATAQQLVAKACHPPSQIPAAAGCADDAVATAAARDQAVPVPSKLGAVKPSHIKGPVAPTQQQQQQQTPCQSQEITVIY